MKYLKPHIIVLVLAFLAFAASIFVGEETISLKEGETNVEISFSSMLNLVGFALGFLGFLLFSLRRRNRK